MKSVGETVTVDDMMDALSDVQRRKLLVALLDHNPQDDSPAVLDDSESDSAAVDRLVSMNHVHLPKLADYGFIEWDRQAHTVEKGPKFDEVRPLLELLDDHEDELPAEWL